MSIASKYGIQIGFGAIAMTLRKFDDLWQDHIIHFFPKDERPPDGLWILREIETRNLRRTANQVVAHYSDRDKWPLSESEILALIASNGWQKNDELIPWAYEVVKKLIAVREALGTRLDRLRAEQEQANA